MIDQEVKQRAEDHLHIQYARADISQIKQGQAKLSRALQDHMDEELVVKHQIEQRMAKSELLIRIVLVVTAAGALGSQELIKTIAVGMLK